MRFAIWPPCLVLAATACTQTAPVEPPIVDELGLLPMSRRIDAGDFGRIAAIVVSRDGGVLFEDYFLAHGAEPPLDMKSVEKSVTALAIGIAIDEGALASVEEQVLPAFADRLPHEGDLQLK